MAALRRKLTVLDAMILVAATAAGIAAARAYFLGEWDSPLVSALARSVAQIRDDVAFRRWFLTSFRQEESRLSSMSVAEHNRQIAAESQRIAAGEWRITVERAFASFNVFLSVQTIALVLLGLRQPRTRLGRLARDPGWAGCLTAIVVLTVRMLAVVVSWGASPKLLLTKRSLWPACVAVFDDLEGYAGPSIVAVWVVIAIGGRSRQALSSLGWLTRIAATSWVILLFKGAAIWSLAPL